jgi:hypothetical protein
MLHSRSKRPSPQLAGDGLIGIGDLALLLFAFSSGGRRQSEVASAVIENLVQVDE